MIHDHLRAALAMAVPLEIMRLRELPDWDLDQLAAMLPAALQQGADNLQFGGGTRGETAASFAAHVRGLALLAVRAEGGVDFGGQHWCSEIGCRAKSRFDHATDEPEEPAPDEPPRRPIDDVAVTGHIL
jgi:hypothetical protein